MKKSSSATWLNIRKKEIKDAEAVDWCNKRKLIWAGVYLQNIPEDTEEKKCDIKPKRDHIVVSDLSIPL